jgi:leucyl/phenylalanyl-tRNA--protein transferase
MLTPEVMLDGYRHGIFPMAETRDNPELHWVEPRLRGVFPLGGFHVSRSLRRNILAGGYEVAIDANFDAVVNACAERVETWINGTLLALYRALHEMGHAHSLEVHAGGAMVGGVFGLTIGTAFFGESMFSRQTDASKIALTYLVDRLTRSGFTLFDTQFLTPHLASLGAVEIPKEKYLALLKSALQGQADFASAGAPPSPQELMQCMTQMS